MDRFSAYEYLSFILPGGLILLVFTYGLFGWPSNEPGASLLILLLGACFVAGSLNVALASFFEPLFWGHRPGVRQDPFWGLVGKRGWYSSKDEEAIVEDFQRKLGSGSTNLRELYGIGRARLQQEGKDAEVQTFNRQIGFYRNMAFACMVALISLAVFRLTGRTYLPVWPTATLLGICLIFSIYRYRRFRRRFGDRVVRGVRAL